MYDSDLLGDTRVWVSDAGVKQLFDEVSCTELGMLGTFIAGSILDGSCLIHPSVGLEVI